MDTNRIESIGHRLKGTLKEGLGRIIGDAKLTTDGAAERSAGEAQSASPSAPSQVIGVDTDRILGIGHQIRGALRQGLGSVTGNTALKHNGIAERAAGRRQNAAGGARDEARDAEQAKKPMGDKGGHESPAPDASNRRAP